MASSPQKSTANPSIRSRTRKTREKKKGVRDLAWDDSSRAGDAGLEFWGNSFVADPFGQVVAEASNDKEEVLVVECDPATSEGTRRNWPFLRDRRVDAYAPLLSRWLTK